MRDWKRWTYEGNEIAVQGYTIKSVKYCLT